MVDYFCSDRVLLLLGHAYTGSFDEVTDVTDRELDGEVDAGKHLGEEDPPAGHDAYERKSTGSLLEKLVMNHDDKNNHVCCGRENSLLVIFLLSRPSPCQGPVSSRRRLGDRKRKTGRRR